MKGIFAALLFVVLWSCYAPSAQTVVIDGFAQGTTYHIVAKTDDSTLLQRGIDSVFENINNSLSIYREGSLINNLNNNITDSVDRYFAECVDLARQISIASGGAYDVTIKPLVEAWGFGAKSRVDEPNIDSLLQFVGYQKIEIKNGRLIKQNPNIMVDLNSIAKGYTVDMLGRLLSDRGVEEYLVEVGGEIVTRGKSPKNELWRVGIDRPVDGNFSPGEDLQGIIRITNSGLATSGNYRKFYLNSNGEKIAHIIDPRTGRSAVSNLLSATVIAPTCAMADGYGTMLISMGLEKSIEWLQNNPQIDAYLIYSDQNGNFATYSTDDFKKMIAEQ